MKKVLAIAVAMLLIPFTAFGLEMMSDGDMASITGQSGVAITIENVQIYSSTTSGEEFWFETSRDGTDADKASVGIIRAEGSYDYRFMNAIKLPAALVAASGVPADPYVGRTIANFGATFGGDFFGTGNPANRWLRGDYTGLGILYNNNLMWYAPRQIPAVLSIRVVNHDDPNAIFGDVGGTLALNTTDLAPDADGAYIEIGLPTLEIFSAPGSQDRFQVFVLAAGAYANGVGNGPVGSGSHIYSIGTIYTTDAGSTTAILGGRIGLTSFGQVGSDVTQATNGTFASRAALVALGSGIAP